MGRALKETEDFSSFSELPVAADVKSEDGEVGPGEEVELEDFVFRVSVSGGLHSGSSAADDMCAADEVFFRGQMLPLRRPWGDRGASRSGSSASDSRSTSRSSSSGSHSSGSRLSSGSSGERPRAAPTVSNNFYARPSPTPRVLSAGRRRRSASAAPPGWGAVFRLGVAKAPEIDIRPRGSANGRKKVAPPGGRWSCKCLPDAVEPTAVSNSADRKKKDETRRRDLR